MEPFIADLINNKKIPKVLRYILVLVSCLFIILIGISLIIHSSLIVGKIFGGALSAIFIVLLCYLLNKIYKS